MICITHKIAQIGLSYEKLICIVYIWERKISTIARSKIQSIPQLGTRRRPNSFICRLSSAEWTADDGRNLNTGSAAVVLRRIPLTGAFTGVFWRWLLRARFTVFLARCMLLAREPVGSVYFWMLLARGAQDVVPIWRWMLLARVPMYTLHSFL